jgi:hypothetical protein
MTSTQILECIEEIGATRFSGTLSDWAEGYGWWIAPGGTDGTDHLLLDANPDAPEEYPDRRVMPWFLFPELGEVARKYGRIWMMQALIDDRIGEA